jgi:hypothetical protein
MGDEIVDCLRIDEHEEREGGLNSIWRWYWRSNLGVTERIPRSVGLAEVKVSLLMKWVMPWRQELQPKSWAR